ncbi:UNVERIFIED_CONTAM: hypothetical protein PYX00_007105 [Menopon gallinae]|uniref:INTS8 TPR repeats domain-containing protein n=1 Tax=Menopon gallinae TaxID=328185 RepID=A0AAW2HHL6_9NEOP
MDVDRLRLGSVPLAPDTVLWFEFLLDSTLLEKHLSKPNPDPKPVELMIKFLTVDDKEKICLDEEGEELESELSNSKFNKRSLAIKILAVKVFAFLHWDLANLDSMLPPVLQVSLLDSILYISTEDEFCIHTHNSKDFSQWDKQAIFAITLYHRWVLKAYTTLSLITKQTFPCKQIPGLKDPNDTANKKEKDLLDQLDMQKGISVEFLRKILGRISTVTVPTIDSFVQLTEDSTDINVKWTDGVEISAEEFQCQLAYELGCYSFYEEDYVMAEMDFASCLDLYQKKDDFQKKIPFCVLDKAKLDEYCKALRINYSTSVGEKSLLEKFRNSIKDGYNGIMQILQEDNVKREIPLNDRTMLEVDIQVAMCKGTDTVTKDTLFKIQILNTLRRVMTNEIMVVNFAQILRSAGDKGVDFFLVSLKSLLPEIGVKERTNIKYFLLDSMLRDLSWADRSSMTLASIFLENGNIKNLFTEDEISDINWKIGVSDNEFEEFTATNSNDVPVQLISRSPRLEIMNIQQQLIQSYDTSNIKNLLTKLCSKDPTKSWWKLNNKWDLPIPLQSVVMTLTKGYIQDLVYILLAKSRELSNNKDFRRSILLLENTEKEVEESSAISRNTFYKLNRLIDWEILLVQINQYLEEYPENNIDPGQLISSCKSCLAALQSGDSVIPRLEVMENCALALLNLGEWEMLTAMDKRWTYLELAAAIAYACQDINKHKGSKKISRDAWDLILPVFGPAPPTKRSASGATVSPTGSNLTKNCLVNFLLKLRESNCLTVVISLLARLHNVLKDEPSLEISCQYIGLWPAVVSNSNSYSSRSVAEVLTHVTLQALKFMPNHFPFLKVLGDINFCLK